MIPTPRNATASGQAGGGVAPKTYFRNHSTSSGDGINNLLSRLQKVRRTGNGTWMACCPAHEDRTASLSIREKNDGRVLLHCFAGCEPLDILAAIGLTFEDVKPPRAIQHGRPESRPFPAADALRAIANEGLIVAACGRAILSNLPYSERDQERLVLAVHRIQAALSAAGVRDD